MTSTEQPLVSVVIPCLNEEEFIARCLESVIANDYPREKMEVLIVDGRSDDDTRIIVEGFISQRSLIRLLDNPKRTTPSALNIGIRDARGDIIIRMDAHATYQVDYISKCVKYLYEYNADNVGGVIQTIPREDTLVGRAIAAVMSSPFGVGDAIFRIGAAKAREVESVFGGCYRRNVFERIGFFNESLPRGQDREFNTRLRESGGRILLFPDIVCSYYPRSNFMSYIKYAFTSGGVPFLISRVARRRLLRPRNFVPLLFVAGLVGSLCLSLAFSELRWLLLGILVSYLVIATGFSVLIAWRKEEFVLFFAVVLLFAVTHVSYGVGSLFGAIKPLQKQSRRANLV